jgi:hypothetical protein
MPPSQRGLALIAIVTLVALIAAYLLVAKLRGASDVTADRRSHNAEVLNRAKQALVGYVAQQALQVGEPNPGRLPCPEHPGYIGDPASEGIAGPGVGVPAPLNCVLVGRLPWRTLGVDKLVDAWNEPLWYVVSPGVWSLNTSTTKLKINSDTAGALTVDGAANAAIALIIAPGPAMKVQAAAGCAARTQARGATPPNALDYIECFNAGTSTFASTGPATSFNDQVVRITVADVMPGIEAAIAERIRRDVVPTLKAIYVGAQWGLPAGTSLYPFASPFANPGPGGGTSSYQGEYAPADPGKCPNVLARCQGLLPLSYSSGCPGGDPRCSTSFVQWAANPTVTASNGVILDANCGISGNVAQCDGHYAGLIGQTVQLRMVARARNVAMALRKFVPEASAMTWGTGTASAVSVNAAFNSDGSVNVTTQGGAPGADFLLPLGVAVHFQITTDIAVVPDHDFLNASTDPTYGWFWRNEWYRLLYYAPALGTTAAGLPTPSCTTGVNCLSVANIAPAGKQRAILILAGRNIKTNPPAARPSGNVGDYLEFGNADGDTAFEQQPISTVVNAALKAPFNDRIIVLDANP